MADANLASFLIDKLGAGSGAPASSPLTPTGGPAIKGYDGGRNTAGFMSGQAMGALPTNVTASQILTNLDNEFVQRYVIKLEEAKGLLKAYLGELDNLSTRLSKADAGMRAIFGEAEIDAKKVVVVETISKLIAHQKKTYERFHNQ